jgi:hypothetical protein
MKTAILAAALIASIAMVSPVDAASKKRKKVPHRTPIGAMQAKPATNPHDVYVSGELVGRDPDPSIRAYMMRNPHIWDGPE